MTDKLRRSAAADLATSFELLEGSVFAGFVVDPANPSQRFTIELLIDGLVVKTAYAENYVGELASQATGDGCYGFALPVSQSLLENATLAEARVATLGLAIGSPLILKELRTRSHKVASKSNLDWRGGLRFSGWIVETIQTALALEAIVDGEVIMQVQASGWAQADDDVNRDQPARAFDFHLPERFADGCVRRLSIRKAGGETLGEPLAFVAFPDGLASTLSKLAVLDSERLRGVIYDRLIPMSLPMSSYEQWQARFPPPLGADSSSRCAVVLVGAGSVEATLESLENQTHAYWTACAVEHKNEPTAYNVDVVQSFFAEDANDSEFVVFALAGTVFETHALNRIAQAFGENVDAVAVYGDVAVMATDGGLWPIAFPAFDYERLLEQGYCAHLFALRRRSADQLINASPANLYRLFNSLFDSGEIDATNVVHIPGSIATLPFFDVAGASAALEEATSRHLRRRKIGASLTATRSNLFPAVRVQRALPDGRTTIVIPTRNRLELLRDCLDSIEPAVDLMDADILIVDNDSTDPETCAFLAELSDTTRATVIRVEGPFNYSRLNNIAAQSTRSEFLCLLNNDIKALDADWLSEMLTRCEPDVGAVGALLLWPSGLIQHGGVVLGPSFSATHAFNDRMVGDPGYAELLRVAHECSAVTAACLLTRRRDYIDIGGMDEVRLPVSFNDVDYCLKLRRASKRIVFTPHAKLIHLESASRGKDRQDGAAARFGREIQTLRARWGQLLIDDPYYNPMLSLDQVPFSGLAWPPRSMSARPQGRAIRKDLPEGF
jgi:GT2 family glycosyltransferase